MFSLVDAMLLRGLPYPDADRLVVLIGNVQRGDRRATRQLLSGSPGLAGEVDALRRHGRVRHDHADASWVSTSRSGSRLKRSRRRTSRCWAWPRPSDGRSGRTRTKSRNRDAVVILSDGSVAAALWRRSVDRQSHDPVGGAHVHRRRRHAARLHGHFGHGTALDALRAERDVRSTTAGTADSRPSRGSSPARRSIRPARSSTSSRSSSKPRIPARTRNAVSR